MYQTQEKGCGFASVKMAMIHVTGNRDYAYVAEPSDDPTPELATVLSYARDMGLHLRAFKTPNPGELEQAVEFPLILVLREDGPFHLVFVPRRKGGRFLVLDPSRGPYWIKSEDLVASFTGVYLKIESYEEGGQSDRDALADTARPISRRPLHYGLALLPMAFMLSGLAFLDFSFPPWAILTAFGATIAASFVQRWSTLVAMRRFDKRYLCGIDATPLRQRRELYVHYHAFKKAVFVSRGEVLGRFATVAAAFFVFLLHDPFLAAFCAIGLALTALGHLLISPKVSAMRRQAEKDEERYLHGSLGPLQRQATLTALSSRAERYGRILGLKEASLTFLGLCLASLACHFAGSFTLQPFIFDFVCVEFFLMEGDRIFHISPILSEKKREETYFRVHILPRVMERNAKG